jgi:two-component system, NarL family, nitrate/nitrite response regulator NarL
MIGVLIVASIRLYREGLELLLSRRQGFTVVGTACGREETIAHLTDAPPTVVLLDSTTSDTGEIVRDVRQLAPAIPIVALGMTDAEQDVLSCIEAGVAGFVSRDGSLDELVSVIESAARGELQCSPKMAGRLMRRIAALATSQPARPSEERLTVRERQIARLIEENLTNKEIATRLGIEVATVKNHVHNLLDKLNIHRRSDLVRWSMRLGGPALPLAHDPNPR